MNDLKQTTPPSIRHLIGIAVLSLFASQITTHAAVISVNLGNTSSTSEAGFDDWQIGGSGEGTPVTTTIGGIQLTGTALGDSLAAINRSFRATYDDRPLPQLTRSWWGANGGSVEESVQLLLQVSGSDLGTGLFDWTSWHVDHDDQTGKMLVEYSVDGGGTYSTASSSFDIVDGRDVDLFEGAPNPLSFSFASNGTDDIIVRYTNLEAENNTKFVVVNGFEITAIPEPGTLVLLGISLLAGVMFRRRK